jgi:hypothetical protein
MDIELFLLKVVSATRSRMGTSASVSQATRVMVEDAINEGLVTVVLVILVRIKSFDCIIET